VDGLVSPDLPRPCWQRLRGERPNPVHPQVSLARQSAWSDAAQSPGAEGLHVHDLRHTGNTFAASGGAGINDGSAGALGPVA
jgi:integrase